MATANELLTRAVSNVTPKALAEEKLKSGKQLRLYFGIDPTGNKLHLGHALSLRKMQAFVDAGHEAIFLIGSFTAMVGDPTGRDAQRNMLTKQEVENNFQTYKEQASKILDFNRVKIRYNHEWLEKLSLAELMNLASKFTVQQMLERDMFRDRMSWKVVCVHCKFEFNSPIQFQSTEAYESATLQGNSVQCPNCGKMTPCNKEDIIPPPNPISPNEFLYPIMQGYDSVMLDVDLEIGGNDQLFNMLAGRKLQKHFGKRDKFIITTKILEGTDGRKMSKTYDNCVYLTDEPDEMFGKLMRIHDELIPTYFECTTNVSMKDVKLLVKELDNKAVNPKDLKMRLAREVVTLYHGEEKGRSAEEHFARVFSERGVPEVMDEITVNTGTSIVDALVAHKLISSKNEARRLISQGGLKLDGKRVDSADAVFEHGGVLKIGKRMFVRVTLL